MGFSATTPQMTDGGIPDDVFGIAKAGDDVAHHQNAECGDGDAAQNHQDLFERIERAPFQLALLLQDQAEMGSHL